MIIFWLILELDNEIIEVRGEFALLKNVFVLKTMNETRVEIPLIKIKQKEIWI